MPNTRNASDAEMHTRVDSLTQVCKPCVANSPLECVSETYKCNVKRPPFVPVGAATVAMELVEGGPPTSMCTLVMLVAPSGLAISGCVRDGNAAA